MPLEICVLASGSSGNCTYVGDSHTAVLIDAGLSGKETARRLGEIGVTMDRIQAVCLTHEHGDHIAGISVLHRRHGIPIYANSGTLEYLRRDAALAALPWKIFTTGSPFAIGTLTLDPFSVSHDAYEPVGFVVSSGPARAGIATDVGMVTTLVRERLRGCHALVIEANHDLRMLDSAARPWSLKQRIRGRQGHLSNEQTAEFLAEIAGAGLEQVFLAHLSSECNDPGCAAHVVARALAAANHAHVQVQCAAPDRISARWIHGAAAHVRAAGSPPPSQRSTP